MANSHRKTNVIGNTMASSEKEDKQRANRTLRRSVKQVLSSGDFDSIPLMREVSNSYTFAKDGKSYISKDFYEDEGDFKKLMRK
jgi:hypothetical protein